jgi:hypothetical protein
MTFPIVWESPLFRGGLRASLILELSHEQAGHHQRILEFPARQKKMVAGANRHFHAPSRRPARVRQWFSPGALHLQFVLTANQPKPPFVEN